VLRQHLGQVDIVEAVQEGFHATNLSSKEHRQSQRMMIMMLHFYKVGSRKG
jgi:hypothetical protein